MLAKLKRVFNGDRGKCVVGGRLALVELVPQHPVDTGEVDHTTHSKAGGVVESQLREVFMSGWEREIGVGHPRLASFNLIKSEKVTQTCQVRSLVLQRDVCLTQNTIKNSTKS